MTKFFVKQKNQTNLLHYNLAPPRPKNDYGEIFSKTYNSFKFNELSTSEYEALGQIWQPIVDYLNDTSTPDVVSGHQEKFYNPADRLTVGFSAVPGHNQRSYYYETGRIFDYIKNNKEKYPDLLFLNDNEIHNQSIEFSKEVLEDYKANVEKYQGLAAGATRLAAGIPAFFSDPVIMFSMYLSLGKGLFQQMLRGAVIGAGTEAMIQPKVKEWYESLDAPYGYNEFRNRVLAAGAFGAGFPAVLNGLGIGYKKAKEGFKAYTDSKAYKPTQDDVATNNALEDVEEIKNNNPLKGFENREEKFFDKGDAEHLNRTIEAEKAVENLTAPNMPNRPSTPIKLSDNILDADSNDILLKRFDPFKLEVDAQRFQFKGGGDKFGVSKKLQGVTEWDDVSSGIIVVFRDINGKEFIVDGHQRLGLAKRIMTNNPKQKILLPAYVFDEATGFTASQVRVAAAMKNIREGSTDPVDVFKIFLEDPKKIKDTSLPPQSAIVRVARNLVKIHPDNREWIFNELIDPELIAVVGKRIDPDNAKLQEAALRALAKAKPTNINESDEIVQQVIALGYSENKTVDLFGESVFAESLIFERAKILDLAKKKLLEDKKIFKNLTTNVNQLERVGNKLAKQTNERRVINASQAIEALSKSANTSGPINESLTNAARTIKEGGSVAEAANGFVNDVRRAIDDGSFLGSISGRSGQPGNAKTDASSSAVETEPNLERYDEINSKDYKREAQQAVIDEDIKPREAMQEEEALRDDFKKSLENKATEKELFDHPAVKDAIEKQMAIPETIQSREFKTNTNNYIANRKFTINNKEVVGYKDALVEFFKGAVNLAFLKDLSKKVTKYEQKAFIVIGPPASGKSAISDPIARKYGAAVIDSDEIKKTMPEYQGGIGANAVHEESSLLSEILLNMAVESKVNMVLPKVGGSISSLRKTIKQLKKAGYKVNLIDMSVQYEESLRRMFMRFIKTGRLINPSYVKKVGNNPSKNYDILKKKGEIDGFARIDNNPPKDQPKIKVEDSDDFLQGTGIPVRDGRGVGTKTLTREEFQRAGQASPSKFGSNEDIDLELADPNSLVDDYIPKTARELHEEIIQDDKMLDRLRGCVV